MQPDPHHRGLTTMQTLFTCALNKKYAWDTNPVPDRHSASLNGQRTLASYTKCMMRQCALVLLVPSVSGPLSIGLTALHLQVVLSLEDLLSIMGLKAPYK